MIKADYWAHRVWSLRRTLARLKIRGPGVTRYKMQEFTTKYELSKDVANKYKQAVRNEASNPTAKNS